MLQRLKAKRPFGQSLLTSLATSTLALSQLQRDPYPTELTSDPSGMYAADLFK